MRISKALIFFTHLIALCGFGALSITGAVSPVAIAIFSISLALSFVNEKYQKGYYLGTRLSSVLAVFLILYVGFNILLLGQEIIKGLLDFLIFTQVLKLLGRKTNRDVIQIYILSFFQFLAGTVLTQSFSYGIVFLVYIAVSIWAIMVYSMHKDANVETLPGHKEDYVNKDPKVVTPLFLSTTFILSFCIFIVASLIFVSVPRIRSGFFQGSFLNPIELRTGFSEEVTLGRVGEIKLDDSAVLRARILNPEELKFNGPIYWRGIALDHFDGRIWKSSGSDYKLQKTDEDGVFRTENSKSKLLAQEIVTEPLDSAVLFSAERPVGFKVKGRERLERINDSYMLLGGISGRMKYYAYSDTYVPSAGELRASSENYPAYIKQIYLQLPPNSDGVGRLAGDITKGLRNPYDKAQAIKLYLLQNYEYSRTLDKIVLENPLEDFLFEKKSGHCEYFSAAMVMMLRESGIPARIVNGFVGGEWNPHGGFYLVRESDAHSWAEAYFPSYGWVAFDATPESESAFHEKSVFFALSYLDYLRFRWQRYVIDFNQRDQIRLLGKVESGVRWQGQKFSSLSKLKTGIDKNLIASAGVLVLALYLFIKRPGALGFIGPMGDRTSVKASRQYKRALKHISKKGYEKPSSMTPLEFSEHMQRIDGKAYSVFSEITKRYLAIRFGDSENARTLSELARLVGEFKKST